jgi:hypothetical protein
LPLVRVPSALSTLQTFSSSLKTLRISRVTCGRSLLVTLTIA